jgi:EAL domain-containing protein (putative c-di-GMP-specific phosphodiesterase class I)
LGWHHSPLAERQPAMPPAPVDPFALRPASPPTFAGKPPFAERSSSLPAPPTPSAPLVSPHARASVGTGLPPVSAPVAAPPAPPLSATTPLQTEARAPSASEGMQDYWAFRPAKPALPEASQGRRKEAPLVATERETDLDAMQGMIKRLSDEVGLGTEAAAPSPEAITRASADVLQTTAKTMRAAVAPKATSPAPRSAPQSMPPPIAPGHARMSSLAAALATGRMEVLVEPIVGLGDHHVHYYEAIVSLHDEHGAAVPLAAHDPQLARTGVLPLLDCARLKRAAQACRILGHQRQKYCVLAAASAEALSTDAFLDELAGAYREHEALAGELVLTFSLADVKAFGSTEWSNLTDMRDLGFRFGLNQTTDLNYEFSALRAAGFSFVKIDAAAFLNGLPAATGIVAPADVCRSLAEIGLITIVDSIDSEATRAKVVSSGVTLGQGPLFGAPQLLATDTIGTAAA